MGDLWPFSLLFRSLFLKDCSNLPPMDLKDVSRHSARWVKNVLGEHIKKLRARKNSSEN